MQTEIEKLTTLQEKLGYEKNREISTVAMLGLVGEGGEVLAEVEVSSFNNDAVAIVSHVIEYSGYADSLKKRVRKGKSSTKFSLNPKQGANFDSELADTFYYLNILAMNRGLSINDLAKMGHDKILRKIAEGGSSEDPHKKVNS